MQGTTLRTIWISILSVIPASYCVISEAEYSALFAFVALYLIDIATGLIRSHKTGVLITSNSLWNKTLGKGIPYAIAIIVFYIVSRLPIPIIDYSFCYIISFLAMTEAYSNLENLAALGIKFPAEIIKKINTPKKK